MLAFLFVLSMLRASDNASAGNLFVSAAQSRGLDVAKLTPTAQVQLVLAHLIAKDAEPNEAAAWDAILGKPATFPPAAHTHPEYDGLEPHTHAIADVADLQSGLDAKADDAHGHAIADTVGLQDALDAKADESHGHPQSDVVGLEAAIAGKSDVGHGHAIGAVTGLQAALDGKAALAHGHTVGDTTGLQAALDAKQASAQKGQANGYASLDGDGKVPAAQLPDGQAGVTMADVIDTLYPVGSLYTSTLTTNPATLLGRGTWTAFGAGRVMIGHNAADVDFDTSEKTGGAKTVTLTEAQIPSHTHVQNAHGHTVTDPGHTHTLPVGATDDTSAPFDRADAGTNASGANASTATGSATTGLTVNNATAVNQNTGGGQAHPNLPPYITVVMWKRTA